MEDDYLSLSGPQRRVLLEQSLMVYGWTCCICGLSIQPGTESLQHVVPRSKGGLTTIENCKPAHKVCNYELGNKKTEGPAGIVHDGSAFFLSRNASPSRAPWSSLPQNHEKSGKEKA